jgi:hypothetical protein
MRVAGIMQRRSEVDFGLPYLKGHQPQLCPTKLANAVATCPSLFQSCICLLPRHYRITLRGIAIYLWRDRMLNI